MPVPPNNATPLGSERSPRPDYPFDAFLADFDALTAATRLHDTPSHSFVRAVLVHFRTAHTKRRVRLYRLIRFLLAATYLAEHFHEFDTEDFAVYGSDRAGGLVGEPLLRAVHHVFAVPDVFALSGTPAPADVLALARSLRAAGPTQARRARSLRVGPQPPEMR